MPPRGSQAVWDDAGLTDPHGQPDKAARVRAMFDAIAPTYRFVNRVLSVGRDAYWRREAVAMVRPSPADLVLDVACGTGDLAEALVRAGVRRAVGCDFSLGMLRRASSAATASAVWWCAADALAIPFASETFDIVACAFGLRNFQDPSRGLEEMRRVLRVGGRVAILEFSIPGGRFLGPCYAVYFHRVLPRLAAWISGDRTRAYHYLPKSVASFGDSAALSRALADAGFSRVAARRLTGGIVTVFVGWKDR